jgi:hypothetical protein
VKTPKTGGFLVARTVDTLQTYMKPEVESLKKHVPRVGHSKAKQSKRKEAGTVIEAQYDGDSTAIYLNSVKRKGAGRPGRSVPDEDVH